MAAEAAVGAVTAAGLKITLNEAMKGDAALKAIVVADQVINVKGT